MPECGHLSIEANETTYFNSQDLERGNLSKGLSDGTATIATGIAGKEVTGIVSASLSLSGETINVSATNLTAGYSSLLGVEPTFVSPAAKFVMQGPSERSCRGQNGRRGSRGSNGVKAA